MGGGWLSLPALKNRGGAHTISETKGNRFPVSTSSAGISVAPERVSDSYGLFDPRTISSSLNSSRVISP